jgi:hypothetical protein
MALTGHWEMQYPLSSFIVRPKLEGVEGEKDIALYIYRYVVLRSFRGSDE